MEKLLANINWPEEYAPKTWLDAKCVHKIMRTIALSIETTWVEVSFPEKPLKTGLNIEFTWPSDKGSRWFRPEQVIACLTTKEDAICSSLIKVNEVKAKTNYFPMLTSIFAKKEA